MGHPIRAYLQTASEGIEDEELVVTREGGVVRSLGPPRALVVGG